MAQYKVPQDVEADDKLLGPFSFRQFVYLLVAGGLIALAVALFQLFPLLAIIPLPFILLLGALALPLKKDQPMETYLAAIVSYYLKPRTRRWVPGQRDTTIEIAAPKIDPKEEARVRDISGEEATHRLSFLADIVDTEGYAIKGANMKKVNEDLVIEANTTYDMFENNHYESLESTINKDEGQQREKVIQEMRNVIAEENQPEGVAQTNKVDIQSSLGGDGLQGGDDKEAERNILGSDVVIKPNVEPVVEKVERTNMVRKNVNNGEQNAKNSSIIELANNKDFSIATISKEANRIKERNEGEVFVSLH